jgi:hypothetical protein
VSIDLSLDERFRAVVLEEAMDNIVVLSGVLGPVHMDGVRLGVRLELLKVLIEMDERVLLDGRGKRAQLLPFRNALRLPVALLPQVPQALVMHLLVFGRGDEARGGFGLINGTIAMDFGAARLRLRVGSQRLRGAFRVIEAAAVEIDGVAIVTRQKLGMQHAFWVAHALAPLRTWAIWMNLSGMPMRSAQPF